MGVWVGVGVGAGGVWRRVVVCAARRPVQVVHGLSVLFSYLISYRNLPSGGPRQYIIRRLSASTHPVACELQRIRDHFQIRFENRKEAAGRTAHAIPTRSHANANVVAGGSAEKRCTWIDELAFLPRARVPVACSYPAHALGKHSRTSPSSPVGSHYSDALHALSCTWSAKLAICSQSRSDPRPS